MMTKNLKLILPYLIFCLCHSSHAIETHTKWWNSASFYGSLSKDKRVKYYLQPDLRFVDSRYKFSQFLVWYGLGYQVTHRFNLFVGDAINNTRNESGDYRHFNILWQQAELVLIDKTNVGLISRTRLQETKNHSESPWGINVRQLLRLELPLPHWEDYAFVLSDEVFFGLKKPAWLNGRQTIQQNRAYAGIRIHASNHLSYGIGYINQYLFGRNDQVSNVLSLNMTVTDD